MRLYGDWVIAANNLRLVGLLEDANEVIALFARCAHRENEGVSKFFQLLSESWEFYFLLVVDFYFWGRPLFFFCLSSLQCVFYKLVDKILVSSRVRVSEGFYVVFCALFRFVERVDVFVISRELRSPFICMLALFYKVNLSYCCVSPFHRLTFVSSAVR